MPYMVLACEKPIAIDTELCTDEIARVVVFVRPGDGKNALAQRIARSLSRDGFTVAYRDTDCVGDLSDPAKLRRLQEREGVIQVGAISEVSSSLSIIESR